MPKQKLLSVNNIFVKLVLIVVCQFYVLGNCNARTIIFFYAIDTDWVSFQRHLGGSAISRQVDGRSIFEIRFRGDTILAAKMGSGAVRSAISAQAVLGSRACDLIVSVGPVGALSSDLKLGDFGFVERVIPWQKQSIMPGSPPIQPLEWEQWKPSGTGLDGFKKLAVASGEMFVNSSQLREQIADSTGCNSVDMNLFGILSAISDSPIRSLHIRVISDNADEEAGASFQRFLTDYDGKAGAVAAEVISKLPPDLTSPSEHPRLMELMKPELVIPAY